MKTKYVLIIGLALSVSAGSMFAQNSERPNRRGPRPEGAENGPGAGAKPMPSPLAGALDADRDGTISAAEIANAPAALKALDKNSDGQLTKEELHGQRPPNGEGDKPQTPPDGQRRAPGGKEGHPPVPPIVGALDADRDGTISAAEIAGASASLLKLDKNGDGQLTKEEMHPMPPKK